MFIRFDVIHERDGQTDRQTLHDSKDRTYASHRAVKMMKCYVRVAYSHGIVRQLYEIFANRKRLHYFTFRSSSSSVRSAPKWNICNQSAAINQGCHKCFIPAKIFSSWETMPIWNLCFQQRAPPLMLSPREPPPLPENLLSLLCVCCWRAICFLLMYFDSIPACDRQTDRQSRALV